ncbi:MAG: hypothetical protein ACQESR_21060 [Planctomycetota bacterium]
MESCPTQAVLPSVGLAAETVIRDGYNLQRAGNGTGSSFCTARRDETVAPCRGRGRGRGLLLDRLVLGRSNGRGMAAARIHTGQRIKCYVFPTFLTGGYWLGAEPRATMARGIATVNAWQSRATQKNRVAVHGCRYTAWTQAPAWMPRACPVVVHARRYKLVRTTTPGRR